MDRRLAFCKMCVWLGQVTMDGSNTTSILRLVPTADDHDAQLICSAVNPLLGVAGANSTAPSSAANSIETRRQLIVHCKIFSLFFLSLCFCC